MTGGSAGVDYSTSSILSATGRPLTQMYPRFRNHLRLLPSVLFMIGAALTGAAAQTAGKADQAALLRQAAEMLERGEAPAAEAILRKIVAAEPRNGTARTLAGIAAERQGKTAEAEKDFAAAARLQPDSPAARNNNGAILVRLGKLKLAEAEFSASLALNPDQPSAIVNLAQIRFREGTAESLLSSLALFEKALVLAPDAEVARAAVAVALRLGNSAKASKYYAAYAQQAGNSVTAASRLELGQALLAAGLGAEAVAELQAAKAADPSNAEVIVSISKAYLAQKNVREAGRTLESAVAGGLRDPRIYAALADVYEAAGYPENAIPAMRLAIENDPKNEFYRIRYGLLLIDTKAPAAAIIRLKEAIEEFPRSPRLLLALGIAEQVQGLTLEAQASFEKALALEPNSVPIISYLVNACLPVRRRG